MKKLLLRQTILFLIMLFTSLAILQVTYGYFDILFISKSSTINIGDWMNNIPNSSDVRSHVYTQYGNNSTESNYILDTIGTINGSNYSLDPTFINYTWGEITETVKLIKKFKDDYFNASLSFPSGRNNDPKVGLKPLDKIRSFLPGDVQLIRETFMLDEIHASSIDKNTPVTFQISIELPNTNISDFSLEVLVDNTPLNAVDPFDYESSIKDGNTYYGDVKRMNTNNNLVSIPILQNSYDITFRNTYNNVSFLHQYNIPTTTGNWTRFAIGSLNPTNNISISNTSEGMRINGNNTGTKVIMNFHILNRNPRNSTSLPIIPIVLVVSRGKKLDLNGNVLTNQSTNPITPIISMRVVSDTFSKNQI